MSRWQLDSALALAHDMQESQSIGSVLHCSLMLLAYKSFSYEVDITPFMFDKANTKGLEDVLHFLLTKLRGASQAKKDFKGIWPIQDSRQQRDYRKVVHALLTEMEQQDKLPRRLVAALQSMFTTAAGSRVTELLCHLACHVLSKQMPEQSAHNRQTPVQDGPAPPELLEPAIRVAQAHSRWQRKQFLASAATYSHMQEHFQSAADHLLSQFKKLQLQQQQQSELDAGLANSSNPPSQLAQDEQLQQAKARWSELQEHLQSLGKMRLLADSVVGPSSHPHAIDGAELSGEAPAEDNLQLGVTSQTGSAEGLTKTVDAYRLQISALAGAAEGSSMTPLALPADQGGHQSHLAAALSANLQSLDQQKQLHADLQADMCSIVAYRQMLVQQVAAAMQKHSAHQWDEQENVSPNVGPDSNAQLPLVPPTPVGIAPMQAATASVAAKKAASRKKWSALTPSKGGTAMKASVQQAAKVREHNWTPGGARMPLRLAIPSSTARPTTRAGLHGSALMTSVVKRGRDLLAPSPITEEDEGSWAGVAGPRRLSYSSPSEGGDRISEQGTSNAHQEATPTTMTSTKQATTKVACAEAPLSVAALLARMQKLKQAKATPEAVTNRKKTCFM